MTSRPFAGNRARPGLVAGLLVAAPAPGPGCPRTSSATQIDRVHQDRRRSGSEEGGQGHRAPGRRPQDRQRDVRLPRRCPSARWPDTGSPAPRPSARSSSSSSPICWSAPTSPGSRTTAGEKIAYNGDTIDGDAALVKTKIITKQGTDIPVDYRMLKRNDRWLVYDVVIEGVSLINNYRTQFNKIIQTSSYQSLVDRMKNKQNELIEDDKGKKS